MTASFLSFPEVTARLRAVRLVPVIVIDDPAHAIPLAGALVDGGLSCAEITFRTPRALEALRRMTAEAPSLFAGAGTVLTPAQATAAREAGAQFIVAPGLNPRVVEHCLAHEIPVYPGIATPTELEAALALGLTTVKFFPAEPLGGLAYLKAMASPYGDVSFMPTGGIHAGNVASYLAYERVLACGGSWMAPAKWINGGEFDRIRDESQRAVAATQGGVPTVSV